VNLLNSPAVISKPAPVFQVAVSEKPNPDVDIDKRWLLARLRTIRAGIQLILTHIDELGIDLTDDMISSEQAAAYLTSLETLPVHFAAHILSPVSA
jgi:hypothetical protein